VRMARSCHRSGRSKRIAPFRWKALPAERLGDHAQPYPCAD
jgi:hypothetical protein